ncbi:hypothetical protein NC652_026882 [Populus alba x Populus x berolinensis]|uniref:Uncharacterized protein n=1 Tax=Populus alba x Populus x berolinensis TaxID=444605 RepID=A0AAD6ME85_9ROSI|nr:hypothetical protein NC652_026882 [Populus alba x Populus x berolinensis]KAJ6983697.1 hypothetical protein NC653_026493 [Populus alba x Populus x berolinensis]
MPGEFPRGRGLPGHIFVQACFPFGLP